MHTCDGWEHERSSILRLSRLFYELIVNKPNGKTFAASSDIITIIRTSRSVDKSWKYLIRRRHSCAFLTSRLVNLLSNRSEMKRVRLSFKVIPFTSYDPWDLRRDWRRRYESLILIAELCITASNLIYAPKYEISYRHVKVCFHLSRRTTLMLECKPRWFRCSSKARRAAVERIQWSRREQHKIWKWINFHDVFLSVFFSRFYPT